MELSTRYPEEPPTYTSVDILSASESRATSWGCRNGGLILVRLTITPVGRRSLGHRPAPQGTADQVGIYSEPFTPTPGLWPKTGERRKTASAKETSGLSRHCVKRDCRRLQAAPTVPVRLGSPLVWTEGVHSLDVDPSPPIPRPTTRIWDQSATKGWQLHIYAKIIDIRVN